MFRSIPYILFAVILLTNISILGQNELPQIGIQKGLALGVVKSIGEKKLVLETRDGILDVILLSITAFKRLPPDNLSLKAASQSNRSEIAVGDRVLVTGKVSIDKTNILTKTVYLVKNSDVKAALAKDKKKWKMRGISGRVSAIDPETETITIELRSAVGAPKKVKITPKEKIKYLRYASNSVKYDDAIKSDFTAIKPGDMLSALGDKSQDHTSFNAEEILSGAFQTVAGPVKAINIEKNEVTIHDLKTKKDFVILVNPKSLLKKFPLQIAQVMAMRQRLARMGISGQMTVRTSGGNNRSSKKTKSQRKPLRGSKPRPKQPPINRQLQKSAGGNINDMLKGFPTVKLTDLKVGDMIAVSSSKSNAPTHLIAIKLLAGVEPFLKTRQVSRSMSTSSGGGNTDGFSIPGLNNGIPNQ